MKDLDALRTDLAKRILQLPPTSYYQSEPWVVIALAIIVKELDSLKNAIAAEREACAKVADAAADRAYARFEVLGHDHNGRDMIECLEGRCIAAAIRERKP